MYMGKVTKSTNVSISSISINIFFKHVCVHFIKLITLCCQRRNGVLFLDSKPSVLKPPGIPLDF